jgi:hypothetical protein
MCLWRSPQPSTRPRTSPFRPAPLT